MAAAEGQRGFTLGETLTALAVVGIGLSLAMPGLGSLTRGNHLAASVNQLVATMHVARSEAVTRNARVTVCASSDGSNCDGQAWEQGWIAFLDADADGEHSSSEMVLDEVSGLTGLAVRSLQFEESFTYESDGHVSASGRNGSSGAFSLCEPQAEEPARVIILRANGLPALSENPPRGSVAACPES
jgi:type IV fimbrial biogenesis protein FimT